MVIGECKTKLECRLDEFIDIIPDYRKLRREIVETDILLFREGLIFIWSVGGISKNFALRDAIETPSSTSAVDETSFR